jgi:hypothetical protein
MLMPEGLDVGMVIYDASGKHDPPDWRFWVARVHSGGVYVFDESWNWEFISAYKLRDFALVPADHLSDEDIEDAQELREGRWQHRLPQSEGNLDASL